MKKYAYTLVTSPQRNGENVAAPRAGRTLTLRETLIIDGGPSYQREYIVATDGFGITVNPDASHHG
ncbi:MAG TPA: hypothetical protein VGE69_11320 [Pseudomonadales bacterium]